MANETKCPECERRAEFYRVASEEVAKAMMRANEERDAALAELAQERSEEPGTVRARMNGLAKWAVDKLGHKPYSSRPFELTIMEALATAQARDEEAGRLRKALEKYGRHEPWCLFGQIVDPPRPPCDCGFDAALGSQR